MRAALSNTSHSKSPRRNTAAGVGIANGNSRRNPSPARCSSATTGVLGSGAGWAGLAATDFDAAFGVTTTALDGVLGAGFGVVLGARAFGATVLAAASFGAGPRRALRLGDGGKFRRRRCGCFGRSLGGGGRSFACGFCRRLFIGNFRCRRGIARVFRCRRGIVLGLRRRRHGGHFIGNLVIGGLGGSRCSARFGGRLFRRRSHIDQRRGFRALGPIARRHRRGLHLGRHGVGRRDSWRCGGGAGARCRRVLGLGVNEADIDHDTVVLVEGAHFRRAVENEIDGHRLCSRYRCRPI